MPDPEISEQLSLCLRHSAKDGKGKGILDPWTQAQVLIPCQVALVVVNLKTDRMPLQPAKNDVDQLLAKLPDQLPGGIDWLPPLDDDDLEPAPEDSNAATSSAKHVGAKVRYVLGIDIIDEGNSAMPQHLRLPGVHSSNVDPDNGM